MKIPFKRTRAANCFALISVVGLISASAVECHSADLNIEFRNGRWERTQPREAVPPPPRVQHQPAPQDSNNRRDAAPTSPRSPELPTQAQSNFGWLPQLLLLAVLALLCLGAALLLLDVLLDRPALDEDAAHNDPGVGDLNSDAGQIHADFPDTDFQQQTQILRDLTAQLVAEAEAARATVREERARAATSNS